MLPFSNGKGRKHSRVQVKRSHLALCGFLLVLAALWLSAIITTIPAQDSQGEHRQQDLKNAPAHLEDPKSKGLQQRPIVLLEQDVVYEEVKERIKSFLHGLRTAFESLGKAPPIDKVWEAYKLVVDEWLAPMDIHNKNSVSRPVRDDRSIFVSVASYRDENCPNTLNEMYTKAAHPERLHVGVVQQNCVADCTSGVLEGGKTERVDPDPDCVKTFCLTPEGGVYCGSGQVREIFVEESESLGPAIARYIASKLWMGEQYFMQVDAHSLFEMGWDDTLIRDMENTPSFPKSVLSHYPPDTKAANAKNMAGLKLCSAAFSADPLEVGMVRLGGAMPQGKTPPEIPCPAPFTGAGFIFAHASFLEVMPFDPYLPWVFMGEEILLTLRFWTWGYRIYAPTHNVVRHFYIRKHTPKFWETIGRLFGKNGIHTPLMQQQLQRIKHLCGYPEASRDLVQPESLLTSIDVYGAGDVMTVGDALRYIGLDPVSKTSTPVTWCINCQSPFQVIQ